MRKFKSTIELEIEVNDESIEKIVERFLKKYTGNAVIRAGSNKQEGWIVCYTTDEIQFQDFLHTEFLKLIPDLEVVKEGDINTLSWPTKLTSVVLETIAMLEAMPII